LNLFFNESVVVYKYDGSKTTYNIPMNRRVYVIEDIDCMTDVTLDRSLVPNGGGAAVDGDAVTLSFLLNLLDGVLETPGRILIITSNYPEKLDKALVRPGRIDVKIEFSHASREFIREMVSRFYSKTVDLETIPIELDNIFTPAEVMESLCTYFKDSDKALRQLVHKRPQLLKVNTELPTSVSDVPKLDDAGTSLESLGISAEPPAPKNEIIDYEELITKRNAERSADLIKPIVQDNETHKKVIVDSEHLYKKDGVDLIGSDMAFNAFVNPPVDSFLTSGVMIDTTKFSELLRTQRFGTEMLKNTEILNSILKPNPEFIEDLSDVNSFDPLGNTPSMWSDANEISNPILDEATASRIVFPPAEISEPQYRGVDIDGPRRI
jgi:hypothetical protein